MLDMHGVTFSFDGQPVLRGIDLHVEPGEIICLLGPSGCGKTTLLRVIAGLENVDHGDVLLAEQSILDIPVHQRDFGLMFQDFALFPHMDVADNVMFGLKMAGLPKPQRRERLQQALALVGLSGFEYRDVSQLSGGERQRVALARSLAPNPRLLMLDEPLGSLDASLRERLIVELHDIIKRVGLTTIYVTHDQAEAFAIADRIAIMNAGVIEQIGAPEDVYRCPQTVFSARFLGFNNIVPVLRREGNKAHTPIGKFNVWGESDALLLHPDSLSLTSDDTLGAIKGYVQERVFLGDAYRLKVACSQEVNLTLKVSSSESVPHLGDEVALLFDVARLVPLREANSPV